MKNYVTKYQKLYDILKCDSNVKIPINDLDAYIQYPKYNFAYNKLMLAQFQGLESAPMPIEPKRYPVIVRPMINLYGMGMNSKIVNNHNEFVDCWGHYGFWTELLDGPHISYDFVLVGGEIVWSCGFRGYALYKNGVKVCGPFRYWESFTDEMCNPPPIVLEWLKKFEGYNGCINIECINDKMIECHLRMGDIDQFSNPNLLKSIIGVYQRNSWSFSDDLDKVYLFPVWYIKRNRSVLPRIRRERSIVEMCEKDPGVLCVQIDDTNMSNPDGFVRLMNITTSSYECGVSIVNRIYCLMYPFSKKWLI